MTRDAELGPLDAQLPDPRGSAIPKSALNSFKSLEYLQRYALDTLNLATILLLKQSSMDIPYAIEKAMPFVSCIVTPLYQQVDPQELGEARRHLSVAEEYCKRIMKRYAYSQLTKQKIDNIASRLVWEYPSHSFVIDLDEARQMGIHASLMDEERAKLCYNLIKSVDGCFGFISSDGKPKGKTGVSPKSVVTKKNRKIKKG